MTIARYGAGPVALRPATAPMHSRARKIDGRHLRSERTRLAIIESYLELLPQDSVTPTASHNADCSVRSIFLRFSDLDALSRQTKKSPGSETILNASSLWSSSDQPAFLQQPYPIGGYRDAFGGFTSAHQPPAYLGVVDRRIHTFGRVAQIQRSAINIPRLRPMPGEFVDLGDDFENQGRNTVARFWHCCRITGRRQKMRALF